MAGGDGSIGTVSHKQFAPAFERNRDPILSVLKEVLPLSGAVLEIGAGTGQHAAYFASRLPNLAWQPTDRRGVLPSIEAWRHEVAAPNLLSPLALDVFDDPWPVQKADAVVCINTIHIVSWAGVERLVSGAASVLHDGGIFFVYGPYRYRDRSLEPSNRRFDEWLQHRDPRSGIREFEAVDELAEREGLRLGGDRAMPSNNRSIWWYKRTAEAG